MLKSVTVINYKGEKTVIELGNPEKSGFLITEITGLGPGKATINMTEISSYDGAVYNSSRLPARNITISFRYLWAETIEDSRQASYGLFPLRKKLRLIFEADNRLAAIDGIVEANEPVIFDQASHTQVSIICEDPYFYSYENEGQQSIRFETVEPTFEFPEGGIEFGLPTSESGIEFGQVDETPTADIVYTGDTESGLDIYIKLSDSVTGLCLSKTYSDSSPDVIMLNDSAIETATGNPLQSGDELHICTRKGSKRVILTRNEEEYNIMNALGRHPTWFTLTPGQNTFLYSANGGTSGISAIRFDYRILYEGV